MVSPRTAPNEPLALVARGWHVFPVDPDSKGPRRKNCDPCADAGGKSPATCPACVAGACSGDWCHSFNGATADPERIRRTWPVGARTGVAVKPSGLAVLDVEADGVELMRHLWSAGVLTPTLVQRSSSGLGAHLFYRAANGSRHLLHPHVADGLVDGSNAGAALPRHLIPQAGEDGKREWAFDVLMSTQAKWTGDLLLDAPVADWPVTMTEWLAEHAATGRQRDNVSEWTNRPRLVVAGVDMPGCIHNAAYRAKGHDRGVSAIRANPTRDRGARALAGAVGAVLSVHWQCSGTCGDDLTDDLLTEYVTVVGAQHAAHGQRAVEMARATVKPWTR
ncbi:bifunctional DNA primase/polymerase [Kitasatospora sp. NPDC001309]|uniref:bifunctional DNA primase/polymerase n=1 Tax=Kitasatospora sp. NPDC001309 TaxID=3364013 RepID=UPI00369366B8